MQREVVLRLFSALGVALVLIPGECAGKASEARCRLEGEGRPGGAERSRFRSKEY